MLASYRETVRRLLCACAARAHAEDGQVLAMSVLFMVVLLGAGGLALDVGIQTVQRRSAQAAADAAALAGAAELTGQAVNPTAAQVTAAITAATTEATNNGFTNGVSGVTVTVNSPPTTTGTPHYNDIHSVEVIIRKNSQNFFLGVLPSPPARYASGRSVATGFGSYTTNPTIALLDPHLPEALDVGITGAAASPINITVDGPLVVNSDHPTEAEQTHNNYNFISPTNAVRGAIDPLGNGTIGPSSQHLNAPIPDPLAAVPIPSSATDPQYNVMGTGYKCPKGQTITLPNSCNGVANSGIVCDSTSWPQPSCLVHRYVEKINPGVWYDLSVDDDGGIIMNPGIYIITGYLQLIDGPHGPGSITGNGVMLYFACPDTVPPYWKNCPTGGGTGNQNGSGPGGFLNLTGANLTTTGNWSPEFSPHSLAGSYNLTAPTSGPYKGLLVFYDRQNYNPATGTTEDHPVGIAISGDSTDTLSGTLYAAATRGIFYSSTPGSTWTINSCFVLNTLEIDGKADYHITCGQGGNYYNSAGTGSSTLTE